MNRPAYVCLLGDEMQLMSSSTMQYSAIYKMGQDGESAAQLFWCMTLAGSYKPTQILLFSQHSHKHTP